MKPILTPENLQEVFEQHINISFKGHQELTTDNLIRYATGFFENYKFQNSGRRINQDYLVFDYGVYPRKNEFGNYFAINITRHFSQVNAMSEFQYKLCFAICFYDISLLKIGLNKIDMRKFDTIQKWVREIKKLDGYKATKYSRADLYDVELTDAPNLAKFCE